MKHEIPTRPLWFFTRTNPPVFVTAAAIMFLFILYGTLFTKTAQDVFTAVQTFVTGHFSWVFTITTCLLLFFALFLLFSPYGKIRLGKDSDRPEFSFATWFAMLFSAGMGIGLIYWSVAEPISHYKNPPISVPETERAAEQAMQLTFFHWGLHAWAIYCVVGMALAYFAFRKGLPLTIRSAFYPLLGDRIYGPFGHVIDIFSVVSTMFGVATSLGLGAMQVNSGLHFIAGVPQSVWVQVALISFITLIATFSVMLGLHKGISRLSHFNLWVAGIFLLFVFLAGPTLYILTTFGTTLANYAQNFLVLSVASETMYDVEWRSSWTTFYWAWWIAWSPFVGMFIARVSRGRTIREFILGCLLAPCLATFAWLSVFGGTAIHLDLVEGGAIAEAVDKNVSTALFFMLESLPLDAITATIATVVIITFFVTSSDSGSFVIDMITAGGDPDPPKLQRLFWAVTEGVIAIVLLIAGGLNALQTAAITTGLPFAIVLIGLIYGLRVALLNERRQQKREQATREQEA
ncbi:BCCT family transporter [Nitrospina sp. 32_T5]|uniref:BCCT family transporter n=1 Tax=unclassified Nitrospina TaxID=2638683 RepID=UPI003F9B5DEB